MGEEKVQCRRCARWLRPGRARSVPAHKCGHGKRCLHPAEPDHCIPCRAALEGTLREIPCVFCGLVPRKVDCYSPSFARGGCEACAPPGFGGAGSKRQDPAINEEILAQAVDIFAGLR